MSSKSVISEIIVGGVVCSILVLMLFPLPTWLMDIALAINIAVAIVIIVGITKGDPIGWAFGDTSLEVGTGKKGFATTSVSTYQPFSVPLTYKDLTTMPDSVIIVITSTTSFGTGTPGQQIWIDNLYFSGTSSVKDILTDKNIRIYPNPVRDVLSIDVWGDFPIHNELQVLDQLGKTVYSGDLETNFSKVNLSGLNNGIYVLRLKNENGIFTKKMLKR